MAKKVRVETVVGEGGTYRAPELEQRVHADARAGLTHRWRRLPAFIADLLVSIMSFSGAVVGLAALVLALLLIDSKLPTGGMAWAFGICALLSPTLIVIGTRLDRRRKTWRDARRAHAEASLAIGRDVVRFGGASIDRRKIERVRVQERKAAAPVPERKYRAKPEVRYDVVIDVKGEKTVRVLEALEEKELVPILAAFDDGGLEVER